MTAKMNFINGVWVPARSGKTRKIINPATSEVLAEVADSGVEDVRDAIAAAKESFYGPGIWRRMPNSERSKKLYKVADEIERISDELCRLESMNTGMTYNNAVGNIGMVVGTFRYYAGLINKSEGHINPLNAGKDIQSITIKEPVGVCGLIAPWNVPLLMFSWKAAPALAAGNSIVFKPASLTPLTAIRVFEVLEEVGFPKGVVNLVTGPGGTIGNELASNVDVDMVTMTGSTAVGQDIIRASASNVKKVGLELGGKSPIIVYDDANIENAVEWVMETDYSNQGANCCAGSRVFVDSKIHDEFVKLLVEKTERVTVGIGLDNPNIGAVVSKGQIETIMHYIELGKKEGAKCLAGGYQLTDGIYANGNFVRPTVFDECTPDMTIVKEEIFGPVVTIQTFETEEEAFKKANDTCYGLAGGVFTENYSRALRAAEEIRAGIIWINHYNWAYEQCPWGGYKMSGLGRELGEDGLEEFQETKQINVRMDSSAPGMWK